METRRFRQPCCVPGCPSELTDFRFPTDPALARKWRRAIKRFDFKLGLKWRSNVHDTICREHFVEDDFEPGGEGKPTMCFYLKSVGLILANS